MPLKSPRDKHRCVAFTNWLSELESTQIFITKGIIQMEENGLITILAKAKYEQPVWEKKLERKKKTALTKYYESKCI